MKEIDIRQGLDNNKNVKGIGLQDKFVEIIYDAILHDVFKVLEATKSGTLYR